MANPCRMCGEINGHEGWCPAVSVFALLEEVEVGNDWVDDWARDPYAPPSQYRRNSHHWRLRIRAWSLFLWTFFRAETIASAIAVIVLIVIAFIFTIH